MLGWILMVTPASSTPNRFLQGVEFADREQCGRHEMAEPRGQPVSDVFR